MSKDNFTPTTESFADIIDNSKKYYVPKYQRDYSWDNLGGEWDLLWEDIISNVEKHYVGILVFQETESGISIIDGQQRLTTILIIILAALYLLYENLKNLSCEDDKKKADKQLEILMSKYIGKEEEDLKYYNKISLNDNNDAFFKELCHIKENGSVKKVKPIFNKDLKTNKTLLKALKFFYEKLKNYIFEPTPDKIINFINENISKKLIFTKIIVNKEENAYMLFETLNSRSVELSSYDLLKNHLLAIAGEKFQQSMLDDIALINTNIGSGDITRFIAMDWNCRHTPKVMEKRIYRTIAREIKDTNSAFHYTKVLKKSSDIYKILKSHNYSQDIEVQELLKVLKYIPRISQHNLIILSLFHSMDKYKIKKIINCLLVLAIRYNYVCQKQANKQETIYNRIATKIFNREYLNEREIIKELKESDIYIADEEFVADFIKKDFATESIDRYLLAKIEEYVTKIKLDYDSLTIEHISDKSKREGFTNKIGNQTLLSKQENSALSGKSFEEKVKVYAKSNLNIVNTISGKSWTENIVAERSKDLANIACKVFVIK